MESSFIHNLKAEVRAASGDGEPHTASAASSAPHLHHDDEPAQDTMVYEIYDPQLINPTSPLTPEAVTAHLTSLRATILTFLAPHLSSYIWHQSPFTLSLSLSSRSSLPPHLQGATHYGDSVDDEFFIVSLLFSLSAHLRNLVVHLRDHDGDFLLIEAAHALPQWAAAPDRTRNRVWLRAGRLYLVPPTARGGDIGRRDGLELLMQREDDVKDETEQKEEDDVDRAVKRRLAEYPRLALDRNVHQVRCWLPLSVARVLREDHTIISGVVNAFYTRDLIDMRVANKMQAFLPSISRSSPSHSPSPASLLTTVLPCRVRFTRLLYVQMEGQPFTLPRSLLFHPALSSLSSLPSSSPLRHAFELGMKVMAGMEMYLHSLRHRRQKQQGAEEEERKRAQEERRKRDERAQKWRTKGGMTEADAEKEMRGDGEKKRRWRQYCDNLLQLGWFKGAKKGDSAWAERVLTGWLVFEEEEQSGRELERRREREAGGLREGVMRHLEVMERVIGMKESDVEGSKQEVEEWKMWDDYGADDSDEWMRLDEHQLEAMIADRENEETRQREQAEQSKQHRPQHKAEREKDDDDELEGDESGAVVKEAQSIVTGMKDFIATISTHEGAELPARGQHTEGKRQERMVKEEKKEAKMSDDDRFHRLLDVLSQREPEMIAAMVRYEAEFGRGSFEADLMRNAGKMKLDGEDVMGDEERDEEAGTGGDSEDEGDEFDADGEQLQFEDESGSVSDYFAAMTRQLRSAGIGKEFERRDRAGRAGEGNGDDDGAQDDDEDEADPDLNLLSNLLSSHEAQHGQAGPASNLMGAMDIRMPTGGLIGARASAEKAKNAGTRR